MVLRIPPEEHPQYDLDVERSVLGSCLIYPELLHTLEVTTSDFFGEAHRSLWREMQYLAAEGEPVDQIHLATRLQEIGKLPFVGGHDYLLDLTEGRIPVRSPPVDLLKRYAKRRVLRELGRRLALAGSIDDDEAAERALRDAHETLDARSKRAPTWELRSTAEIFAPLPPVAWRVRGLQICPGRPCILGGYGASAKTLSAQQLALAVASGTAVWGFFDVEDAARVIHLDYEQGFPATAQRYQRLAFGHHIDPRSLSDRLQLGVFPDVYLDQPGAYNAYAKLVDGVGLVVLDALRGATPNSDENDSSIRVCIDNLTRVSEVTGCAFVLLHHARKKQQNGTADAREGLRGSAAIFDGGGAVYELSPGKDKNDPKCVRQTKSAAEATGRLVDDFMLDVLDIPAPGNPEAGVRVTHKLIEKPDHAAEAMGRDQARKMQLYELIKRNPGQSKSAITRIFLSSSKGNKSLVFDLLVELHRDRRIRSVTEGLSDLLYVEEHSHGRSVLGSSPDS